MAHVNAQAIRFLPSEEKALRVADLLVHALNELNRMDGDFAQQQDDLPYGQVHNALRTILTRFWGNNVAQEALRDWAESDIMPTQSVPDAISTIMTAHFEKDGV